MSTYSHVSSKSRKRRNKPTPELKKILLTKQVNFPCIWDAASHEIFLLKMSDDISIISLITVTRNQSLPLTRHLSTKALCTFYILGSNNGVGTSTICRRHTGHRQQATTHAPLQYSTHRPLSISWLIKVKDGSLKLRRRSNGSSNVSVHFLLGLLFVHYSKSQVTRMGWRAYLTGWLLPRIEHQILLLIYNIKTDCGTVEFSG
jgi:hypothetical protein